MLNNWKPKSNYNIFVSRNHTNRYANKLDNNYDTVIDKGNSFRARPLKHYRRQYVDKNNKINKGKFSERLLTSINAPGGFVLRSRDVDLNENTVHSTIENSGLQAEYMLSKKSYEKSKCDVDSTVKNKTFSSNRELLYNKQKTYTQNLPIKKTNSNEQFAFSNASKICKIDENTEAEVDILRYSKPTNKQYLAHSAVSSSNRTLKTKYNVLQTTAKTNNLARNSLSMALAYNMPMKSMKYNKYETCHKLLTKKRNNYCRFK
jgi:hypothetical protein